MDDVAWKDWFAVGHDTIDLEHKTFFSLINKANDYVKENRGEDDLLRIFDEILKYADFHFTSEENVMLECDYPYRQEHHEEHRRLMITLRQDITSFEGGNKPAQDIVRFLYHWLLDHTITEDLKISATVKQKKLKSYFKVMEDA